MFFVFFFKQKTAYEISACLVGSEMCIRDRTTGVSSKRGSEMADWGQKRDCDGAAYSEDPSTTKGVPRDGRLLSPLDPWVCRNGSHP